MKTVLIKKYGYYIALSLMLIFCAIGSGFAQSLKTPYPIIFVHGTGSNNNTWGRQDNQFDNIVDYLEGAGLKLGDSLKLSLNYQRTLAHFNTTKEQDVHLFNTNIGFGDFYTVSFDVRASGTVTTVNDQVAITSKCLATDNIITVNHPSQFIKNDILRIKDEFMQVTGVNGNLVSVKRHLLGTVATEYPGIIPIYNLSNQSNQASIAKQGYALKLAIDAIIKKTNAKKVILVGHSMGGLAAREYIKNYANNNVAKIVTVGTPHYGTNVTDFNNAFINVFLPTLDERSEAVRDLRTDISGALAPYLFGGYESSVKGYYSSDINCDGVETSIIDGLNSASGYSSLNNIARTWIASNWSYLPGLGYNDAVVLTKSEYISSDDTLMTNKRHDDETRDYYTLLRGLDEPDDPALAYEIQPTSTTKGFVTFTKGEKAGEKNPYDRDLFKINITRHTHLQVDITAGVYTGINTISLLDADLSVRKSISHVTVNPSISDDLEPGIYYIQVYGTATPGIAPDYKYASYNYPYTINTTATVIPDPKFSISPTGLLTFYDVVLGQYQEKNITLTNNGTSTVAVSNLSLSGIDAGQFIITTPTTFAVQVGMSQAITLRFKPTSAGVKNAAIKIESNSADNPAILVALTGTGADHAAKTLVINNDPSYSFGDVTVAGSKINTFTLQNTGSDPLLISGLSISGADPSAFTITPVVVPFTLQTGSITSIVVEFSPATVGSKSGSLVISNNSDNYGPNHSIALYGNGSNSIYSGISGSITGYEYWFDDDYSSRIQNNVTAQNISYLNTNFQTTSLTVGSHILRIRYVDKHGLWSAVMSQNFYKQPLAPNSARKIEGYEYWFDDNYASKLFVSITTQVTTTLNANISTGSLSTGSHLLNIRYKDDNGQWSNIRTSNFYRQPLVNGATRRIISYEYWFDDSYTTKNVINITPQQSAVLNGNINTLGLAIGQHNLHIRYKDDSGQWSFIKTSSFYRRPLANGVIRKIVSYEYWFDDNYSAKKRISISSQQSAVLNKSINTSNLTIGQHDLHIRYQDDNGQWTIVSNSNFYNTGQHSSNNTVTAYRYWFDTDNTHMVTATVSTTANPYNFSANINTSTLPNGQHTIHFQFRDYNNAWSTVTTDTAMFYTARPPTITAFTPAVATPGTTVTITGTNFNTVTAVKFGGVAASSFTILSATSIIAVVGPGTSGSVSVTNPDGTFTKAGFRSGSSNALLTSIKVAPITALTVISGPDYRDYTTTVPNSETSVKITPTTQDATATIKVNGVTVASGASSASIPLNLGDNVINTVVTAQDGITTKTYSIKFTRLPSTNANLANLTLSSGTLTPVFAAGTTSYTATVGAATITVTPTASDPNATVKVNGTTVASGTASAALPLVVGSNVITTVVTASDGATTQTYTLTVTRLPNNALLTTLKVTPSTALTLVSGADYKDYTTTVPNTETGVKITPTAQDALATIKVNSVTVASGAASAAIPLHAGDNVINTVVTAQDGITTKTYSIKFTRLPSTNANLAGLTINSGTLSPVFAAGTTAYTATVGAANITIAPTAGDADATIKVNGTAVASGAASAALPLVVGSNVITTVVTASDGTTTKTYTLTVTRLSNNALLTTLKVSPSTPLTLVSGADYKDYTTTVPNSETSVKVIPTSQDAGASIKVNGVTVASGAASAAIPLNVGANVVNTVVTAPDGISVKTYSLTFTRQAPGGVVLKYEPQEQPISTDNITVHQNVSPNGDGNSDVLMIDGIAAYPENKVQIINRSGVLVYEASGYDNQAKVFDGHSSVDGKLQQAGTYFYSLEYKDGKETKRKTGFIVLKR